MLGLRILILAAVLTQGTIEAQSHEFPLKHMKLDQVYSSKGMPLLEGNLTFHNSPPSKSGFFTSQAPENLSKVEYASISITPKIDILAICGLDNEGNLRYYFDTDADRDLLKEEPASFFQEGDIRIARVPITYRHLLNGKNSTIKTELILYERKPGKIEYHFNDLWETTLLIGNEKLNVALQRWSILFIDVNFSGVYEKLFFTEREILALGGKFFYVQIDFPAAKIRLKETDRSPVDQGFPAPEFEVNLWKSEETFKLTEHKGDIVVLTFWSPLCPGSKVEASLYSQLAKKFGINSSLYFLAVTNDDKALENYLSSTSHNFQHSVSSELWDRYGVTAPFVTILIDSDGIIKKRFFQYSADLEEEIASLLQDKQTAKTN